MRQPITAQRRSPITALTSILALTIALTVALTAATQGEALAKKKKAKLRFGTKGAITAAGSLDLSSTSTTGRLEGKDADKSVDGPTSFNLGLRGGYFVWSNKLLAVEGAAEITFGRQDQEDFKSSSFGLFAVPTLYLRSFKKHAIFPFAQVGVGYADVGEESSNKKNNSTSGLGLKPGLGVAMAVGKAQGAFVRFQLNYEMQTLTNKDDTGAQNSGVAARLSVGAFF